MQKENERKEECSGRISRISSAKQWGNSEGEKRIYVKNFRLWRRRTCFIWWRNTLQMAKYSVSLYVFRREKEALGVLQKEYSDSGILCDLSDLIAKQRRLSEDEAREKLWQIISAVDYLHNFNIVHRDLKVSLWWGNHTTHNKPRAGIRPRGFIERAWFFSCA